MGVLIILSLKGGRNIWVHCDSQPYFYFLLLQTHIITLYSALNLLTKQYNTSLTNTKQYNILVDFLHYLPCDLQRIFCFCNEEGKFVENLSVSMNDWEGRV